MRWSNLFAFAVFLLAVVTAYARDVYCPLHSYAPCYNTGQIATTGSNAQKWHCTCGDDVWVAPEAPPSPPPSTTSSPSATPSDGSYESGAKLGAALGTVIAQKRAQKAEEKNALTAVVFCRQNPSGSWTFPGKSPTPCDTLAKNVVAYCTVNPKTAICKDVAKLGPTSTASVSSKYLNEDEKFVWSFYNGLPEDDKSYVQEFCTANPTEKALLPHAKVAAGQPAERSLGCSYWLSAKLKSNSTGK